MPFEEKMTWVTATVTPLVAVAYFGVVLSDLGDVPAAEIDYQLPLLVALVASVVLMVVGAIAISGVMAARAQLTGQGSIDDIDRRDERDVDIDRRGDQVGLYVTGIGGVAALALAMLEADYFWIANTLYLSFVVAAMVNGAVKVTAYRRGM